MEIHSQFVQQKMFIVHTEQIQLQEMIDQRRELRRVFKKMGDVLHLFVEVNGQMLIQINLVQIVEQFLIIVVFDIIGFCLVFDVSNENATLTRMRGDRAMVDHCLGRRVTPLAEEYRRRISTFGPI